MLPQAHADAAAPITGIAAAPRASPAVQHLAAILRGPCGHVHEGANLPRAREVETAKVRAGGRYALHVRHTQRTYSADSSLLAIYFLKNFLFARCAREVTPLRGVTCILSCREPTRVVLAEVFA